MDYLIFNHFTLACIIFAIALIFFVDKIFIYKNRNQQNHILIRLWLICVTLKLLDTIDLFVFDLYTAADKVLNLFPYVCDLQLYFIPIILFFSYKNKDSNLLMKFLFFFIIFDIATIYNLGAHRQDYYLFFLSNKQIEYYFSQYILGYVNSAGELTLFSPLKDVTSFLYLYTVPLTHLMYLVIEVLLLKRYKIFNKDPRKGFGIFIVSFLVLYTYFHIQSLVATRVLYEFGSNKITSAYTNADYVMSIEPPDALIDFFEIFFGNNFYFIVLDITSIPYIYSYFFTLIMYAIAILATFLILYFTYLISNYLKRTNTFYLNFEDKELIVYS